MMNRAGLPMLRILPLLFTMCVLALELSSAANYNSDIKPIDDTEGLFGTICEDQLWSQVLIKKGKKKLKSVKVTNKCMDSIINQLGGDAPQYKVDKSYVVFSKISTWETATKNCQESSFRIAPVFNELENQYITDSIIETGHWGKNMWLAGHSPQNNTWAWTSSKKQIALDFTNWEPKHPRFSSDPRCIAMNKFGRWESLDCNERLGYVCYQPPPETY